MPPATQNNKKEAMACFHVGHQLGAVGAAFMCAAADQAPGFIDAETGEDMEESLTAEDVKAGILSGKCASMPGSKPPAFQPGGAPSPCPPSSDQRLLRCGCSCMREPPTLQIRRYKPCTIDHIYHLFPKDKK